MQVIVAWLKSKNITAHTVCAVLIAAAGIIASDSQVQDFLGNLLKAHPAAAAQIVALAVIVAKYSHSSSPAGRMATARAIAANGNTPTAAQVDAADVAIK